MDELVRLLKQESYLHYDDLFPLHPRARLRVHPKVLNELCKHWEPGPVMGIEVIVDDTMEPGGWQLIAGEGTI